MSAVTWQESAQSSAKLDALEQAGCTDPRLRYWRDVLRAALETALRRCHTSWSAPGMDDATRAVSAIGALHVPAIGGAPITLPGAGRLAELAEVTGISPADEAVLAAAWWSAVDPQLAIAFGCAHDDGNRRAPSLGILHAILAGHGLDVPLAIPPGHLLVTSGLFEAVPDAATLLRLPATTAGLLAGAGGVIPHATPPSRLVAAVRRIAALVDAGARVLVRCAASGDRQAACDAVAAELGIPVACTPRPANVAALLHRMRYELPAALLGAGDQPAEGAVVAFADSDAMPPAGWHVTDVPAPDLAYAEECWTRVLRRAGVMVTEFDAAELAGRLPINEAEIAELVERARVVAAAAGQHPRLGEVRAALRAQARYDARGLARRLEPGTRLGDLVLGARTEEGLHRLVSHARFSAAASARMGLTGHRGRAVIALFAGPSGTGKTAAAEAVAAELDRDLWVVDLAKVVSKWLGETQRNLDLVLGEAAAAGALLLFDEADGLFGKRGEVSDARDRYANMEIDHLLQRIELHTGVVVLTSNRPASLDEAFGRRIRIAVRFELPDHAQRQAMWLRYLPSDLVDEDVLTDQIARHELSGAAIRSAALGATVAALADRSLVRAHHVEVAVQHELAKSNRPSAIIGGAR